MLPVRIQQNCVEIQLSITIKDYEYLLPTKNMQNKQISEGRSAFLKWDNSKKHFYMI
ncbi:unnamed protein product [Paramecium octaurelia]|uniref:Uncharacterized protein n=1 Tax=Paramecium octaurelia TaxID=43137 RepID=A0A8S1Y9D8_PAROT|nr:unnamed protein product [Paramecium octaurelia]